MQAKKRCSVQTLTSTEGPCDPEAGATSEAGVQCCPATDRAAGRRAVWGQAGGLRSEGRAQLRTGSEPLVCVCVCVCVCAPKSSLSPSKIKRMKTHSHSIFLRI